MITHNTIGRYCDLVGIPEVKELRAGMDFRLPQYRREVFLRFYEFHLKYRCHPGLVYLLFPFLNAKHNLTNEQKLWLCFLNGNTQNLITSWLIFQRFPDFQTLDLSKLTVWFNQEFKKLEWDLDRRHWKSKFIESVKRYQMLCAFMRGQKRYFRELTNTDDEKKNFELVWKAVRSEFYSFGRLSTFSYLEYLRIQGLPIDCNTLLFEDLDGSKSHRNGLSKVLGRDDLDLHKSNPTGFEGKYTKEHFQWYDKEANLLLEEAKERFQGRDFYHDVSLFTLESTFCTFKSWFRKNRRYPGVYADMLYNRIKKAETNWPDEDFSQFWEARKLLPKYLRLEDNPADPGLKSKKQNHFRETGEVIKMGFDWSCFKNSFDKEIAEKQGEEY